jgi:hypothetical protein
MPGEEEFLKWRRRGEEEKKEASPTIKESDSEGRAVASRGAAVTGLPKQVIGKQYSQERELRVDLERLGADDLRVIQNEEGWAVWQGMPSAPHQRAIAEICDIFDEWKDGRLIKYRTEPNVFANDSFSCPKKERRCPDFAAFGPDPLAGHSVRTIGGKEANPHVIVQFSWANDIHEEACAVGDKVCRYRRVYQMKNDTVSYLIFQISQASCLCFDPVACTNGIVPSSG